MITWAYISLEATSDGELATETQENYSFFVAEPDLHFANPGLFEAIIYVWAGLQFRPTQE